MNLKGEQMINIIGDTYQELADLQIIIETGILNTNEKLSSVNATYQLRSGDDLLVNQYNHIIGSKKELKGENK